MDEELINLNPVPILKTDFEKAYQTLLNQFENKQSIRTILDRKDYNIKENIWQQVVFNEVEKKILENNKEELLNSVRQSLNNPTVQLDILTDPSKAEAFLNLQSPLEQKIQKFFEENPTLVKLFETFDLQIINLTESQDKP